MKSGPIGIVLGIMIWDNIQMKKKLFEVIENNTKALTKNNETLNDLVEAQNQRRKEFGGN